MPNIVLNTVIDKMLTIWALVIPAAVVCLVLVALVIRGKRMLKAAAEKLSRYFQLAGAVSELSEKLGRSITDQTSSIDETSASTEEIGAMLKKNSDNASKTAQLSAENEQNAVMGKQVVQQMIRAIDDMGSGNRQIISQVHQNNAHLSEVVSVISEIGTKTKVINDIAFQTKLLSFNASIEAARAGEHGKGFAVVAEEVGKLAQMSGNAAKEISGMLDVSLNRVKNIFEETSAKVDNLVSQAKGKIEMTSKIAKECEHALDNIVGNASSVARAASDIMQAGSEQARGIDEISKAMVSLSKAAQVNADICRQIADAAMALSRQEKPWAGVAGSESGGAKPSSKPHLKIAESPAPLDNVIRLKAAQGFPATELPLENDPRFKDV